MRSLGSITLLCVLCNHFTSGNGIERNVVPARAPPPTQPDIFAGRQSGEPACELTSTGFYGTVTQYPRSVSFLYQVNVIEGVTKTEIEREIGPMLNHEIVQGILPMLFKEDCAGRRRNLREDIRKLQSQDPKITGVSSQQRDLATGVGDLPCAVDDGANCFTVMGDVIVFVEDPMTSDDDATAFMEPLVQMYLQANMRGMDPRVVSVHHVVRSPTTQDFEGGNGGSPGGITFVTTPPMPTAAPVGPPPTPAPVPPPGSPTRAPTGNGGSTPSPVPQTPTSSTPAPVPGSGGGETTPAPVGGTENTDSPTTAVQIQPRSASGIARVEWWGWLLIAIGVIALLFGIYFFFGNRQTGRSGASGRVAPKNDGPADEYIEGSAYVPPGADEYRPPGLGTFTEGGALSTYPEGEEDDDEDEDDYDEDEYDEGEGDEEDETYEDGEEDEGESYEEGDEEETYEEGESAVESYEEEETYEEVTVYDEDHGGSPGGEGQQWAGEYSVGRSGAAGTY